MNKVILIGRLSRDNELRYTQNNVAVLNNTIAVNRSYYDGQGERQADFINIVVWRERATLMEKYTKKGDRIAIVGELQSRRYETNEGQLRTTYEVIVNEIEFLEPKRSSEEQVPYPNVESKDNKKEALDRFDVGDVVDLGDEDVPF